MGAFLCVPIAGANQWCGLTMVGGCRYDDKDGRVARASGKQAKPEAWTPDQVYNECALRRKVFIGTVIDATGDGRYYHRRRYVLTAC